MKSIRLEEEKEILAFPLLMEYDEIVIIATKKDVRRDLFNNSIVSL